MSLIGSIWSKLVIFLENGQKIAKNQPQGLKNYAICGKIVEVQNIFFENVLYYLGNKKRLWF